MSGNWGFRLVLLICIVVPHIKSGKWITACHNLIIAMLLVRGRGRHWTHALKPCCGWNCKVNTEELECRRGSRRCWHAMGL